MKQVPTNPYSTANKYTKFKEGKNTFRLFDHISGWEAWSGDPGARKVIRKESIDELPEKLRPESRYFRAFKVWNYEAYQDENGDWQGATQVMVLTQRTILEPLTELYWDTDWGAKDSLDTFDIVISRKGEGLETEYLVTPKPKKDFKHKLDKIDLAQLYVNGDPWGDAPRETTDEELKDITKSYDEMVGDLDGEAPENP